MDGGSASIYRSRLHGGHFGFGGREQNAFEDVSSELHEVRIAENLSRGRGRVDQSLDDRVFASPALNFRLGLTIQNVFLEWNNDSTNIQQEACEKAKLEE